MGKRKKGTKYGQTERTPHRETRRQVQELPLEAQCRIWKLIKAAVALFSGGESNIERSLR